MAGDVIVAIQAFNVRSGTGTQNVTAARLGGATPKAVAFYASWHNNANDASDTDRAWTCIGFASNGVGQQTTHRFISDDNVAAVNAVVLWRTAKVSEHFDLSAAVSAWIADGVTLTWTAVPAFSCRVYAVFFAGADVSAHTDTIAPSGTDVTVDVTAPGFTPDAVILLSACSANASNSSRNDMQYSYGAAERVGGAQRCLSWCEDDAVASGGQPGCHFSDTKAVHAINPADGTTQWSGVVNDFDASGFSVQTTGTTAGQVISYLALKLDGKAVSLFDFAVRTTTGVQTVTDPGFPPQAVLMGYASVTAKNASEFNTALASSIGWGAADPGSQASHYTLISSSNDPTRTRNLTLGDQAVVLGKETTAQATKAALQAFTATGFELDFTAVSGDASYVWALAIEGDGVPTFDHLATQVFLEALATEDPTHAVSQVHLEALLQEPPTHQVSQVFIEVLRAIPHIPKRYVHVQQLHEPIPIFEPE